MRDLDGQTVLITGAAGDLGQALARSFAAQGATLVLTDVDETGLESLAATLQVPCTTRRLDVRDPEDWAALRDALDRLDVLVHNAGVLVMTPFAEQSLADVDWLFDVNLRGPLYGTHTLLPLLKASGGHVAFVASMSSLFPSPLTATYTASKHALRGLGVSLGLELSADGVGVTVALPGTIATGLMARARTGEEVPQDWLASQMRKVGSTPAYVAERVVRGIRRGTLELTIGMDAAMVSVVQRVAPRPLRGVLGLGWRYLQRR